MGNYERCYSLSSNVVSIVSLPHGPTATQLLSRPRGSNRQNCTPCTIHVGVHVGLGWSSCAGQLSRLSGARIDPSTPSLRTRESMMLSPGVGTPVVNSIESHGLAELMAAAEKRKFSHESIALNSP